GCGVHGCQRFQTTGVQLGSVQLVPHTTVSPSDVPHTTVSPSLVLHADPSPPAPPARTKNQFGIVPPIQVSARSTAAFASRKPAPCVIESKRGFIREVLSNIALTSPGVNDVFACSINATVPVTTGAAMLVPLWLR